MSDLFVSGPTSVYLALYLLTWIVHFFLVAGVVGGSAFAAVSVWRDRSRAEPSKLGGDFRGALPLLLGLAITAGVAPLLFVQILYQDAFYTANLLLYVRFVSIVPALMVCFYLFYFGRTERAKQMSNRARSAIYIVACMLALFIGISWVELHSLALSPSTWIERYAAGEHGNMNLGVGLRGVAFLALAAPMVATFAIFLARYNRRSPGAATVLAPVASVGAIAALAFTAAYARTLPVSVVSALTSGIGAVHLAGFVACGVASAVLWAVAAARGDVSTALRRTLYSLSLAWLWCVAVLREVMRSTQLDLESLVAAHEKSFATGGQFAFVGFGLVNALAIAWCVRLIWRVWRDSQAQP